MSLRSKKGVQADHNFKNRKGIHHHLLVHMCLKIELRIMVRTPDQDLLIHMVVWRKKVVSLLHAPSVVGITLASIAKAPWVVSSAVRPGIL